MSPFQQLKETTKQFYLDPLTTMFEKEIDGGYIAATILMIQIERIGAIMNPDIATIPGKGKERFTAGAKALFANNQLTDDDIDLLFSNGRCGLTHQGNLQGKKPGKIRICRGSNNRVSITASDDNGERILTIDLELLIQCIESKLEDFKNEKTTQNHDSDAEKVALKISAHSVTIVPKSIPSTSYVSTPTITTSGTP